MYIAEMNNFILDMSFAFSLVCCHLFPGDHPDDERSEQDLETRV